MTLSFGHIEAGGAEPPQPPDSNSVQGVVLSPAAFSCIAQIAHREAGLSISEAKSAMVRTRLARRLRALRLTSYDDYCAFVSAPEGEEELGLMISALTTNVSHFFREDHHFEILREKVLPPLLTKARAGGRVRLWSAGCSNGQEPYSLAITLLEGGVTPNLDVKILATDIDPIVINHAQRGFYPDRMLADLPAALRNKYFDPDVEGSEDGARVKHTLREMISFRRLNLLHDWPMRGSFDVVFCRNVVIYFDAPTQDRLWSRFGKSIAPDGWLFLGHSERVSDDNLDVFQKRGVTAYQRTPMSAKTSATHAPTRRAD